MGGGGGHYGPGMGGGGGGGGNPDELEEVVEVPNTMVGMLIGRGGENIQSIQRNSGCHVQVTRENEMQPGANQRRVLLRGTPQALASAKQEIARVTEDRGRGPGGGGGGSHYGPGREEGGISVKLPVPNQQVGLIIGKQGSTIRGIQERTGSNIQIPSQPDADDPSTRTICISSPTQQACDSAANEIKALVAERLSGAGGGPGGGPQGPATYMQIPNAHVGLVIGKQGSTIRSIQERTGTRIQIPSQPDPGSNPPVRTVTITGPGESSQQARYEIDQLINNQHSGGPGGGNYGGPPPSYNAPAPMGGAPYGAAPYGAAPYGAAPWGAPPAPAPYDPYGYYAQAPNPYGYGAQWSGQMPTDGAPQAAPGATTAPTSAAPTSQPAPSGPPDGSQQAPQQPQQQGPPTTDSAAAPVDPMVAMYHEQFWQYAVYYGEDLARQYYGEWSPPKGTPPPPGIVIPQAQAAAAPPAETAPAQAPPTSNPDPSAAPTAPM